jgi:hypothetical protein
MFHSVCQPQNNPYSVDEMAQQLWLNKTVTDKMIVDEMDS